MSPKTQNLTAKPGTHKSRSVFLLSRNDRSVDIPPADPKRYETWHEIVPVSKPGALADSTAVIQCPKVDAKNDEDHTDQEANRTCAFDHD